MKKKINFQEKNKLPLTFDYLEIINVKKNIYHDKNVIYHISCNICSTNYNVRREPHKSLVRML